MRERVDTYTGKAMKTFGFRTDGSTRPLVLGELQTLVREHPELIVDQTTLEEMLTFTLNEKMRAEAEPGAHDDCVMALAIGYFARPQQRALDEVEEKRSVWTKSMWEDYRAASAKEKQELRRIWGAPTR